MYWRGLPPQLVHATTATAGITLNSASTSAGALLPAGRQQPAHVEQAARRTSARTASGFQAWYASGIETPGHVVEQPRQAEARMEERPVAGREVEAVADQAVVGRLPDPREVLELVGREEPLHAGQRPPLEAPAARTRRARCRSGRRGSAASNGSSPKRRVNGASAERGLSDTAAVLIALVGADLAGSVARPLPAGRWSIPPLLSLASRAMLGRRFGTPLIGVTLAAMVRPRPRFRRSRRPDRPGSDGRRGRTRAAAGSRARRGHGALARTLPSAAAVLLAGPTVLAFFSGGYGVESQLLARRRHSGRARRAGRGRAVAARALAGSRSSRSARWSAWRSGPGSRSTGAASATSRPTRPRSWSSTRASSPPPLVAIQDRRCAARRRWCCWPARGRGRCTRSPGGCCPTSSRSRSAGARARASSSRSPTGTRWAC